MTAASTGERTRPGPFATLNGALHYRALVVYLLVVAAHWVEHGVQALQIYVFDTPRPKAGGALGTVFPSLVSSELLHWGYAVFMLGGLIMLRRAFVGEARRWWTIALGIQVWHFIEHMILALQAWTGLNLLSKPVPTSFVQLVLPRVELHLIYNMIVLMPLLVAVSLHWFRADGRTNTAAPCSCAARYPAS